jgi:hypothetical protein
MALWNKKSHGEQLSETSARSIITDAAKRIKLFIAFYRNIGPDKTRVSYEAMDDDAKLWIDGDDDHQLSLADE